MRARSKGVPFPGTDEGLSVHHAYQDIGGDLLGEQRIYICRTGTAGDRCSQGWSWGLSTPGSHPPHLSTRMA